MRQLEHQEVIDIFKRCFTDKCELIEADTGSDWWVFKYYNNRVNKRYYYHFHIQQRNGIIVFIAWRTLIGDYKHLSVEVNFNVVEKLVAEFKAWLQRPAIPLCPVCGKYIANCEEEHSSAITEEPEYFDEQVEAYRQQQEYYEGLH